MIETVGRSAPGIRMLDSNCTMRDFQHEIIESPQGYVSFYGNYHDGFYLYPQEVISAMSALLGVNNNPKTTEAAQKVINNGWAPLHGTDRISMDKKTAALNVLSTLCNVEKEHLKQDYQKGRITRKEFRSKLEPILGVSLGILYETDPNRFDSVLRSHRKKPPERTVYSRK